MRELTLEITQFCEEGCDFCSSNATPSGKHLPLANIQEFLSKYEPDKIKRINISGGEPLAHPAFYQILKLCESYCNDVRVYTNALKHIYFNASVLNRVQVEANVILLPGLTIPEADKIHFLKPRACGRLKPHHFKEMKASISGKNCESCDHPVLQADNQVAQAPCLKCYKES